MDTIFSFKKEVNLTHAIGCMTFEDIMLNKPVMRRQMLYDSTNVSYLLLSNWQGGKWNASC